MNSAELKHLAWVKSLPCMIGNDDCCGGVQAHHITRGGRRIDHYHTLPLCFAHHQAQSPLPVGEAVHKGKKLFEQKYGTQMEMLERVRAMQ